MVEAMVALTLADHVMMQHAQCELFPNEADVADQPNPMGVTAVGTKKQHQGVVAEVGSTVSQRVDEE